MTATLQATGDPSSDAEAPQPGRSAGVADLPPPSDNGLLDMPAPLRPWRDPDPLTGWFITAFITVIAGFTRFWGLASPGSKSFDEVYYATEAQELLRYGYENNPDYMFIVHPSVGKWAIALTSAVWGNNPTGWRVAPAIAGVLSVFLIIRIARRMFRSNLLGGIAGLLLTMDGISLVQSRVALLDIFLELFILAGFGALVVDRDQFRARLARFVGEGGDARDFIPRLGPRPWRLAAGVMLGLSLGVKWSALSFWIALTVLSLCWDRGALKSAGARYPWTATLKLSGAGWVGSLIGATVGTYLLTWLGWWAGENSWNRHWGDTHHDTGLLGWLPKWAQALANYHNQAYEFHVGLSSPHVYQSTPWSWWILARPIPYAYYGTPDGTTEAKSVCGAAKCSSEVLLIGTPLMYWAFAPVVIWLAWHWVTTRDWRAAVVLVAVAAGWLVWLRDAKRTMFLFYMTPLMPFLILGLTLALGTLLGGRREPSMRMLWYRPNWRVFAVAGYLGLVIADFVWMWPVFTNVMLTQAQWHARIWFQSWI
ncbi:MAG: rane protein [Pseudonocardiales bacterium]|nr:rane protein [Pseudonocardiales bacterium]